MDLLYPIIDAANFDGGVHAVIIAIPRHHHRHPRP
jgi:hypothetical protein